MAVRTTRWPTVAALTASILRNHPNINDWDRPLLPMTSAGRLF